jgi:hypothetical protein
LRGFACPIDFRVGDGDETAARIALEAREVCGASPGAGAEDAYSND